LLRAVRINAQDMCVVGSNKDNVSNGYAAGKLEFAFCYRSPFAIGGSPTERMPVNNCEHSSTFIGHQTANRLMGEFLMDHFPSDAE
jgi:hypothetical protein